MRAGLAPFLILAACSRREARVGPDPVDAAKPDPVVAEAPLDRFMVGARVVDVTKRAVVHDLQKKAPTFSGVDRASAFVVHEGVVRAFDGVTGKERWHVTPASCQHFAMTERMVYCAGDKDLYTLAKSDGAKTTITGTTSIAQLFGFGRHLIVMRAGGVLESFPEGNATPVATITAALHACRPLVARGDGFCGAASSGAGSVFAGCWSATLVPRWTRTITITKPGDPPFTGVDARRLENGFLVASTMPWGAGVDRSVVIRLTDGDEVARVDESVAAVGARSDQEVDGLVSLKKGLRYLERNGAVRWSVPGVHVDDSASALLDGERLFVANFPMISSGASLFALDRKTGALLFQFVPPMPSIAHSAYLNDVELSLVAGTLVMRGHEAGVEYAALLDRASGVAHMTTVLPLWP